MKHYTYIDQSNFFLEGQRLAAVKNGKVGSMDEALDEGIIDFNWAPDYKRVYEFLCGSNRSEVGCAKIFGSPPPDMAFWTALKYMGFDPKVFQKAWSGKEKKVDVALTYHVTRDAYSAIDRGMDEINLVIGDTDYVPLVEGLVADGFKVVVLFWSHISKQFSNLGADFLSLDDQFRNFTRE
jgi:hypothetical protein